MEQLYATARELYVAGDLSGALRVLKECHEATRAPNLLFNIAQLYRELDECPDAVEYYQRYVTESPDGARVADAKQYLEILTEQCPASNATGLTPASSLQPPLRPVAEPPSTFTRVAPRTQGDSRAPGFRHWDTVGWTAFGVGALATAGAAYAWFDMTRESRDTEDAYDHGVYPSAIAHQDDWYRSRRWALGLGAVAVVSIGIGTYALVIAGPSERSTTHTLSTTLTAASASLDYGWRF